MMIKILCQTARATLAMFVASLLVCATSQIADAQLIAYEGGEGSTRWGRRHGEPASSRWRCRERRTQGSTGQTEQSTAGQHL